MDNGHHHDPACDRCNYQDDSARMRLCNVTEFDPEEIRSQREERRMKELIVPADDLVCLGKDKLQELIRCRNCKYYCGRSCTAHDAPGDYLTPDDFCSWAQPKKEKEEK